MGIILLHELGHVGVARIFGFPTHEITLTGIGGIAQIDMPTDHASTATRLAIYCGGPAVNFGLLVFGLAIFGWPDLKPLLQWSESGLPGWEAWYALVTALNALILLFNMLPIVPLDGGQILRNLTALLIGHTAGRIVALMSTSGIGILLVCLSGALNMWADALLLTVMAAIGVFGLFWEPSESKVSTHESSV